MKFLALKEIEVAKLPLNDRYKSSCIESGIVTLYDLMCYDKVFSENLKGCGRKGDVDLERLRVDTFLKLDDCDKCEAISVLLSIPHFHILSVLSDSQLLRLEDFYNRCVYGCDNRMMRQRLLSVSCADFIAKYNWGEKKILRGVEGVASELLLLKQRCRDYICGLFEYDGCMAVEEDGASTVEGDCRWSLLYKLEDYFKYGMDKLDRNNRIFLSTYGILKSYKHKTIKELSVEEHITYERVRGISNSCYERVFVRPVEVLTKFTKFDWSSYINRLKGKRKYLTTEMIHQELDLINREEHCDFTDSFMIYWLSCLLRNEYTLFDGYEFRKYEANPFLVDNEVARAFDIVRCDEVLEEVIGKNRIAYEMSVADFLMKNLNSCILPDWESQQDTIIEIVEDKLYRGYGIIADEMDRVRIPRGKTVMVMDVLYELLRRNGEPTHIDDLYDMFKREWPDHYYNSPSQLRAYMLKDSRIVGVGNTSKYALREWDNINTKTIRENVYDYLSRMSEPQPLERIQAYLERMGRSTTRRSLQTSLGMSSNFILFDGMLWGVVGGRYSEKYRVKKRVRANVVQRNLRRHK